MRCPRCQETLVDERYESVRLLACPTGHGAILTKEDRRTLTISARATLEEAMEARTNGRLACAMCARPADTVVARRHGDEIELDACAHCGAVWFDAGEVARLHALPPKTARAASATPRGARALSGAGEAAPMAFLAIGDIGHLIAALLDGW
jgi:Zn-finger nucleic acid-binding protein